MIIKLNMLDENLQETEAEFIFKDSEQFVRNHGYQNFANCYPCFVNGTWVFHMTGISGIFNNLPLESYSEVGVGDIGNNWRGNYAGSKIITINFDNVFQQSGQISPNELLDTYVNYGGQYVLLSVDVNDKFYSLICHFTADTNTESNVLALESAFSGSGAFWNGGETETEFYIWELIPAIPLNVPFIVNENTRYPVDENIFFAAIQPIRLEVSGSKNGDWKSVRFSLNGTEIYYEKEDNNKLIIDSENETITDENGNDISANVQLINGSTKLIFSKPGINKIKIIINENYEDIEKFENLATDTLVLLKYDDLKNSLGVKSEC